MNSTTPPKRLIIRLSSLGDVILATSALSALAAGETHWVVSKEYASLLKGHPGLKKIWEFDRTGGLLAWLALCGNLWKQGYTEVFDLHNTLRSQVARIYFFVRGRWEGHKRQVLPQWKTMSKERLQLIGLFTAKRLWPKKWYPTRLVERVALLVGGSGLERPDLKHLICRESEVSLDFAKWIHEHGKFISVMPSSKWDGKKWSVRGFFEVITKTGIPVVVLGEKSDRESVLLVKMLEQAGFPHYSGIAKLSFSQLAFALSSSLFYLGNDTGLAHLAEALGTSVITTFGPTVPEMGFGPWRAKSRVVGVDLWCKPCGKDGRFCYRVNNRYACQKNLSASQVYSAVQNYLGAES
jgi:ADP-heptose:LPS heptosyltransferase